MSSQVLSDAMRLLLLDLGYEPESETVLRTPDRFADALMEMLQGYRESPVGILKKTFDEPYDEMVIVNGIKFWSLCEHHALPFHGVASVGYLPNGAVVGLSKIPRLVRCLSRRLQVQERLTNQIAEAIGEALKPKGVGVLLRATHLCMVARGVESHGEMVTSSLTGSFRQPEVREEFLRLAREGMRV